MYAIIINPISGNGAANNSLSGIKQLLENRNIEYRVEVTETPKDTGDFALRAVKERLEGIIAVGGDGTFSGIINSIGLCELEILFAPCGTGNDFMRMFDLPKDPVKALEKQLDSPVRMIDIGRCNDRYFLNVTGCGFDVDVLDEVEKLRGKYSGFGAYLRGAYRAIKKYRPMDVTISYDDEKPRNMRSTIISIGNGCFIGGGMNAIPGACVDDGMFDVMIAGPVSKRSIYVLLILFILGKHLLFKRIVTKFRCKKIHIAGNGLKFESDGEVFDCDDAELSIIPSALRTRLPSKR